MSETTNPGSRSASEIEREVDRERAEVSQTIDALQDKLSVGSMVDEVMRAVSQHGGDFGRNIGRTVRDNPLPLILTGVGLAWLMSSASEGERYRGVGYDDDWDRDPALRGAGTRYGTTGSPGLAQPYDTGSSDSFGGGAEFSDHSVNPVDSGLEPVGDTSGSEGSSFAERTSGAAGAARDRVSESAGAARDRLSSARDSASRSMRSAGDRMRFAADDARRWGRERGRTVQEGLHEAMEEYPLVVGALALAAGAAIGGALPRTRAEDEYLGAHSDRLKDAARDVAATESEKAKAVAGAVLDEGKRIADETAGKVDESTPEGRSMVDQGKDAAKEAGDRLKRTAEAEAEKQNLGGSKSDV